MRKTLSSYIHALLEVGWTRIAGAIDLMLLFSLSEGIGIALLLPILQISGLDLGAQGALGGYARAVASAFEAVGLHPSLLLLLMVFAGLVGARALLASWQSVAIFSVHQNFAARLRGRPYRAIANANWLALSRLGAADLTHALTAEIERVDEASPAALGLASTMPQPASLRSRAPAPSSSAKLPARLRGRAQTGAHCAGARRCCAARAPTLRREPGGCMPRPWSICRASRRPVCTACRSAMPSPTRRSAARLRRPTSISSAGGRSMPRCSRLGRS